MIRTTDRKTHHIRLVPEDVEATMAELRRRAPQAAQGYYCDIERAYDADPKQWQP